MTADEISGRLGNADSTIKVLLYGSARTAGLACSGEGLWYVLDQSTTPYKPTSPKLVAARTARPGSAQVAQSPNASVSDHSVGASEARGASPAGGIVDDQLWAITLKNLREKLLDLRRTNRLINYREGARDIAIVDESPGQVHQQLLIDSLELALDPKPEPLPDETDTPPPEPGARQTEQQPAAGTTAHPQGALGRRPFDGVRLLCGAWGHAAD